MTLPASGAISIQNIRNEFFGGGGPTDLAALGSQCIGRTPGSALSMSEFYSKTAFPLVSSFDAMTPDSFFHIAGRNATWTGMVYYSPGGGTVFRMTAGECTSFGFNTAGILLISVNGGQAYSYSPYAYNATQNTYWWIYGANIPLAIGYSVRVRNA